MKKIKQILLLIVMTMILVILPIAKVKADDCRQCNLDAIRTSDNVYRSCIRSYQSRNMTPDYVNCQSIRDQWYFALLCQCPTPCFILQDCNSIINVKNQTFPVYESLSIDEKIIATDSYIDAVKIVFTDSNEETINPYLIFSDSLGKAGIIYTDDLTGALFLELLRADGLGLLKR